MSRWLVYIELWWQLVASDGMMAGELILLFLNYSGEEINKSIDNITVFL